MDKDEWNLLLKMHQQLKDNGLTAFSPEFLELYSELFAKSLQGKGNESYLTHPTSDVGSDHTLV